ncbi:hypothetical protein [Sinomonas terrae]|uniref:Uncharacterized protein n=1 Tax=Sinomonas terrae TaxID=2908838 RepID=A0ABS9TZK4_9MICC|nr:hypothetical protein [Sinomonas terrae]MCH6469858.1 hypothetical protein [Sinomonas terrae]
MYLKLTDVAMPMMLTGLNARDAKAGTALANPWSTRIGASIRLRLDRAVSRATDR